MTNDLATLPADLLTVFAAVKTTIVLTETPTYNPTTRDVSGSPTDHTVTNASPIIEDATLTRETNALKAGEASCFLPGSGLGFVPLPGWKLSVGSKTWKVVDVLRHPVDETSVAAYELRLER